MLDGISKKKKVCAIGGGVMGAGTALGYALGGYPVGFWVRREEQRHQSMTKIENDLNRFISEGLIEADRAKSVFQRITPAKSFAEAGANAGIVMESVNEIMDIKTPVLQEARAHCLPNAIFLSNTSSIHPDVVFSGLPAEVLSKVCNVHFFTPPSYMPVVEVIPGSFTSRETEAEIMDMLADMDKKPIIIRNIKPGFVVNAIQFPIFWEALNIHVAGMPAEQVDNAFRENLGDRYEEQGPLALAGFDLDALDSIAARQRLQEPMPLSGQVPGSIAARIQAVAVKAALELVADEVASAKEVDGAFVDSLGRRYKVTPPLVSGDFTGLKTAQSILRQQGYLDRDSAAARFLDAKISRGEIGLNLKEGCLNGVYSWTEERGRRVTEDRIARLIFHRHADKRAISDRAAVGDTKRVLEAQKLAY